MTSSPATSLRQLRPGDAWSYDVSGTLTPPGGSPLNLSGEITVSIVPDRLLGRPDAMAISFEQRFEVTQPDGSKAPLAAPPWMFSFVQDPETRDLAIRADNMSPQGKPRIAKTPQVFYPGVWSSGTKYDNVLEFDNGDSVHNTLTVTGQESVETGQGTYTAWKAPITSESAMTGVIEGMDWWTPELGAPAKFATRSSMPDGSTMQFEATLSRATLVE